MSLSSLPAIAMALAAAFASATPSITHAQAVPSAGNWPQRPVKIVVPFAPGSSPDVFARIVGDRLAQRLGQPVVIENRAGAGGNIGTGYVAKAASDGYTLLVSTNGPLVYNTVLYQKLPYDPFKELRPVVLGGGQPNVCAVRADSGIASLKDLVNEMKRRPGQFNFSSTGIGSLSHLGPELLKARTGTFAVHIPYPSSPQAIMAIIQGDVQFACVPGVAVMPQVKAGRLRAIAVSTGERSPLMPDVPTMKESGFPEVENMAWMAVMAPASTPPDILQKLNAELNAVLRSADVRDKMHAQYMEPIGGSLEQAEQFLRDELRNMTPVIKRSGATVE